MSRPLSLVCCVNDSETISAIEVSYPIMISDMCEILKTYRQPERLNALMKLGNLSFMTDNPSTCTPSQKGRIINNISHDEFVELSKNYPYVYMFEKTTRKWYFCHKRSAIYQHENVISLDKAEKLQNEGMLFTMPD